jgi:hypothetical protein
LLVVCENIPHYRLLVPVIAAVRLPLWAAISGRDVVKRLAHIKHRTYLELPPARTHKPSAEEKSDGHHFYPPCAMRPSSPSAHPAAVAAVAANKHDDNNNNIISLQFWYDYQEIIEYIIAVVL